MKAGCVILVALLVCHAAEGKRILVVPCQITSHYLEVNSLVAGLIENGHDVYTLVERNFPKLNTISNEIKKIFFTAAPGTLNSEEIVAKAFHKKVLDIGNDLASSIVSECDMVLQDKELMGHLRGLSFDLALADGFPLSFCELVIPHVLEVPFVFWFSSIHPYVMRVPALPSFVNPAFSPLAITDEMSFSERLSNLFYFVSLELYNPFPAHHDLSLLKKYAPDLSDWNELARKAVLFIETRDHLLEWPWPSMPNVIRTPGITVQNPKELSQEFHKITKDAANGFILVSFGSMTSTMPLNTAKQLVAAFNQIDIPIIWRFAGELFGTVSQLVNGNIHLFKWIPQNDLLGHSNIKLFITHCGNNGQYEALFHGVPMVGLPLFAEQFHNAMRIMDHGFGVSLLPGGLKRFETHELLDAITEVLHNQSYTIAIQKRSQMLRDNPMTPTDTVTFWLEHVMEFGGDHLQSHAMVMPLYSYYMIDVFAFVICCFFLVLYTVISCSSSLYCKLKMKKE